MGIQALDLFLGQGSSFPAFRNRQAYHAESMNVSIVSTSRSAISPSGISTVRNVSEVAKGERTPWTEKSTSRGRRTGNSDSGTGSHVPSDKRTIGIGQPQYRWRPIDQSRSLNRMTFLPTPRASTAAEIASMAAAEHNP